VRLLKSSPWSPATSCSPVCAIGGIPLPIAQASCRGPAFTLRRVPMAQNDSGQPTLLRSTTTREQARAAGCLPRISLPGRRVQRRPERGNVECFSARRGEPVIFMAQLLLDGRIPQNPAGQSGRGRFGLRPVGGQPAGHPPLLPAAFGPCVAGFPENLAGFPKKG